MVKTHQYLDPAYLTRENEKHEKEIQKQIGRNYNKMLAMHHGGLIDAHELATHMKYNHEAIGSCANAACPKNTGHVYESAGDEKFLKQKIANDAHKTLNENNQHAKSLHHEHFLHQKKLLAMQNDAIIQIQARKNTLLRRLAQANHTESAPDGADKEDILSSTQNQMAKERSMATQRALVFAEQEEHHRLAYKQLEDLHRETHEKEDKNLQHYYSTKKAAFTTIFDAQADFIKAQHLPKVAKAVDTKTGKPMTSYAAGHAAGIALAIAEAHAAGVAEGQNSHTSPNTSRGLLKPTKAFQNAITAVVSQQQHIDANANPTNTP